MAALKQGMVEISPKRTGVAPRDIEDIRYLRFCGLSLRKIAERYGAAPSTIGDFVQRHNLDADLQLIEAVQLELRATYQRTCEALASVEMGSERHERLVALQMKQAAQLMRTSKKTTKSEEAEMSRKSEEALRRLNAMSDEELDNEIRRLAGLESKTSGNMAGTGTEPGCKETSASEPLPGSGDGGTTPPDRD